MANLSDLIAPNTLVQLDTAQTLTNKTVALGSNTVSGTTAEFNTALTDGSFATLTGTQTLTNKTLTSPSITSPSISGPTVTGDMSVVEVTESVYNLTGTDIDPANGTVQYKTLTANTTLTESLASGQSVLLRLAAGATYTVTWFTVTWVGGSAPTLTADDFLVFWQEGTTVYGNYLGSVA